MNSVIGHSCILAGAGIAAYTMSWGLPNVDRAAVTEPATVVVAVPQRTPQIAARTLAPAPPPAATPTDREGLARELHRELKRVGCYDGEITGAWSAPSRKAMKGFIDHVNASLPIDQPDYILLRLVQGHQGGACGAVVASAGERPQSQPQPAEPKPAAAPERSAAITPAPLPLAPSPKLRSEGNVPPPPSSAEPPPRAAPRQAAVEPLRASPALVRESGPVPSVGVYEERSHERSRRAARPPKPPKFVRALVRGVQQALAPFGIR